MPRVYGHVAGKTTSGAESTQEQIDYTSSVDYTSFMITSISIIRWTIANLYNRAWVIGVIHSVQASEDFLKSQLVPSDIWLQARKFPHPVHFAVVVLIRSMRVTAQFDLLEIHRLVHLMRGTQLMMTDDLGVGNLLPPGLTQKVLRLDGGIAQEAGVCHHGHVVLCGHVIPSLESDLGVIHLFGLAGSLVAVIFSRQKSLPSASGR